VELSGRARLGLGDNVLAQTAARLEAQGVAVTALTDTNPTRHGLSDPAVIAALAAAARRSGYYEPSPRGPLEAREALAARFGGSPEQYWLAASTSEAYAWLLALVADAGGVVAVPQPGYPLVEPLARLAGLSTIGYPLHYVAGHGWVYDLAGFGAAADRAAATVLVDPGNPTGAYLAPATAAQVAELALRHASVPIIDQVFYTYRLTDGGGEGPRGAELPEWDAPGAPLSFRLDGLSKLACAPGVKLAWIRLAGPAGEAAAAAKALDAIADTYLNVSTTAALALADILQQADRIGEALRGRLRRNLRALAQALAPAATVRRVEGGWVAIVDPVVVPEGADPALWLLEHAHLSVHPGWLYDLAENDAIVVSLLPEPEQFDAGIAALRAGLDRLAAS
jgi:aspartate/methionine/tyrosine aminotransferase